MKRTPKLITALLIGAVVPFVQAVELPGPVADDRAVVGNTGLDITTAEEEPGPAAPRGPIKWRNYDATQIIARAMEVVRTAAPKAAADDTRPLFHFRPPAQWMNDVCAGFHYRGWHHIFFMFHPWSDHYPHYPEAGGGWGHARSHDLVHWEFLPPVILPDRDNGSVLDGSGSAAFDGSGRPVLFFAKTPSRGQREQWAAVPEDDELIRWRRVDIGLAPGKSGVPADIKPGWADMFVFRAGRRTFAIFKESGGLVCEATRPDLLQWKAVGRIDNVAGECPNLFSLDDRFVLIRSTLPISYLSGDFDTEKIAFTPRTAKRVLDYGPGRLLKPEWNRGLYGTTTFIDSKNRRVLMGWISGFRENRGWNGCSSLPRVLTLDKDGQLIQTPLPELEQLRQEHSRVAGLTVDDEFKLIEGAAGNQLEVVAEFIPGQAAAFGLKLRGSSDGQRAIALRFADGVLNVAGTEVPLMPGDKQKILKLHVFLDRSVIEVFVNDGQTAVTRVEYPEKNDLGVGVFAENGKATLKTLDVWKMKSIW